jgi:hypothetical protein
MYVGPFYHVAVWQLLWGESALFSSFTITSGFSSVSVKESRTYYSSYFCSIGFLPDLPIKHSNKYIYFYWMRGRIFTSAFKAPVPIRSALLWHEHLLRMTSPTSFETPQVYYRLTTQHKKGGGGESSYSKRLEVTFDKPRRAIRAVSLHGFDNGHTTIGASMGDMRQLTITKQKASLPLSFLFGPYTYTYLLYSLNYHSKDKDT